MVSQAVRLVKGRRSSPLSMFCRDERLTAESWACFVKAQTWQTSSSQGGAFRLAKSAVKIADPETCRTEA